jgi:GNAT superfamily N-acetyltransferase
MGGLRVGAALIRAMTSQTIAWVHSHARVDVFVAQPDTEIPQKPAPADLRALSVDLDTLLTAQFFDSEEDRADLLRAAFARFRNGDKCYVAVVGGRLAGYGWSAAGRAFIMTEIDQALPVAADECLLYDFFVFPQWRGRGYYGVLLRSIRSLNAHKRHWIFAQTGNTASIRGIQSAGFVHAFRLGRRVLLGRTVGEKAITVLDRLQRRGAEAE